MRTAVIGISGFAETHLKAIAAHPALLSLDAVAIRVPYAPGGDEEHREKVLEAQGARIYRDYREMLRCERERIDLVTVPCGIPVHAEMSIASLEAGFHVLCEKPAAGNLEDAERMQACRCRTGKHLMIGFQHLLRPSTQYLKRAALGGEYGRLLSARTLVSWPRSAAYYSRNLWAGRLFVEGRPVRDSPLQNACSHFFQNMLYVAGDGPDRCAAPSMIYAENYHIADIESADTQFVRLRTSTGVEILFVATHGATELVEPITEYVFEAGEFRWTYTGEISFRSKNAGSSFHEVFHDDVGDAHDLPFIEAAGILSGKTPRSTIDNALDHARAVDSAFNASGGVARIRLDGTPVDLNTAVRTAFETRSGFAELGLEWARRGRILTL